MRRTVVIVGYPGIQSLDLVGPFDVFTSATLLLAAEHGDDGYRRGYDVQVVSLHGQPVATGTGLTFVTQPLPDATGGLDTVVLPGGMGTIDPDPAIVEWIRAASPYARRIVSVCTGAFLAAGAGLLDGCRVTTHWSFADQLAEMHPRVDVDPDPIFIRSSDKVWTAAGVSSGIDLALALVEEDHGTELAQTVARWLVLPLRRSGGQTQFAAPVWMPRAKRAPIRDVQDHIDNNPGAANSVADLARRAAMSTRHFTRVFTDEVGEAPGAYVERIRTEAARRQLEQSDDTVVAIASRCGFGTAETMRRSFIRRIGVSPDHYRRSFA